MSTAAFSDLLHGAFRVALGRALPPKPQVARHWERADQLAWLALTVSGDAFAFAYSLGTLKGTPVIAGERHTSGAFTLDDRTFPGVGSEALALALNALVPAGDGATRAFLQRVLAQVALARVALRFDGARAELPMAAAPDFSLMLAQRPDGLSTHTATPRMPEHARERVAAALELLPAEDATLVRALFDRPEAELLAALAGHLRAPLLK